jgi:hypothetical protein
MTTRASGASTKILLLQPFLNLNLPIDFLEELVMASLEAGLTDILDEISKNG